VEDKEDKEEKEEDGVGVCNRRERRRAKGVIKIGEGRKV